MELHKLPDTSILFSRYLDSSKLINIYDWYESFKVVLDVQRSERLSAHSQSRKSKTKGKGKASPKKKSKGKGKERAVDADEDGGGGGGRESRESGEVGEEPTEEQWQKEVQARFIRALHELDHLGFIKHTARRVEHVARVVFDIGNADADANDANGDEVDGESEDEE